jgi:NTE family protein
MKKIGLALGGGGAKGFAHIPILEVFDELGIKPYCITGTSIGSIMGGLYASGHTAADIVDMLRHLSPPKSATAKNIIRGKELFRILDMIDPHFSLKPRGLLKGEKFLSFLYDQMKVDSFEELVIPLKVVATDFWRNEQVVFDSGDLLPAIRSSMAIPYVFTPVTIGDRVLVDGGLVTMCLTIC